MDEKHLAFVGDMPQTKLGRQTLVKRVTKNILAGRNWDSEYGS